MDALPKEWNVSKGATDAIESLLMLGTAPVSHSIELKRSHSSPGTSSGTNVANLHRCLSTGSNERPKDGRIASLYQRMRERNNEASKRCRLKRRMKAECLQQQSLTLSKFNRHLTNRLNLLINVRNTVKEGIAFFEGQNEANDAYNETISKLRLIKKDLATNNESDMDHLATSELLTLSRRERNESSEEGCCSNNDFDMDNEEMNKAQNSSEEENVSAITTDRNEEIPTLSTAKLAHSKAEGAPIVRGFPGRSTQLSITAVSKPSLKLLSSPMSSSHPIILLSPATPSASSPTFPKQEIEIKCEPDIQIECLANQNATIKYDWCRAASILTSNCNGIKIDVEKLCASVDLDVLSGSKKGNMGNMALEKAVIKSALRLPFWKVEKQEEALQVCETHYLELLGPTQFSSCTVCQSPCSQNNIVPITYRMSLENHTRTGRTWPIGRPTCITCLQKHFSSPKSNNSVHRVHPVPRQAHAKPKMIDNLTINPSNPSESGPSDSIFAKIARLNDALCAINPGYKPLGFSITNIESCSQSVLKDAMDATETAVATLLSVIAPGQEAFLWRELQPRLRAKYETKKE